MQNPDFSSFHLDPKIALGLRDMGYSVPTPIQARAIPPALQGKDVLGLAQTGTGKTAAFALPILQRLLQGHRGKTRVLVVAPTRELAEQIHESFRSLGRHTHLHSATVYGGVGMGAQEKALKDGTDIIVACPGRLLDHCGQGTADLSHVEVLVLDEADRMFDMGFLPDVRRILKRLPQKRQTLLFSATMPQDVRGLAHEILRDPVTVQVDHAVPLTTVSHALYPVPDHLKADLFVELLRRTPGGAVLVFTRTKHRAKRLAKRLSGEGFSTACLQGDMSQNRRKAALDGFREGKFDFLVATDIAARGIDVSQITHVVNYDVPDTTETYTHRIGRTGRAAKTGDAFTLVTPQDEDMIRAIERSMGSAIERRQVEGFNYGARGASHAPAHPAPHRPQHQAPRHPPRQAPPSGAKPAAPAHPAGSGFRRHFGGRRLRKLR